MAFGDFERLVEGESGRDTFVLWLFVVTHPSSYHLDRLVLDRCLPAPEEMAFAWET